jgi:predicted transcriptional regulator
MEGTTDQANEASPANGVPPLGESTVDGTAESGQHELAGIDNPEAKQYKTLGIRVDNELHAKLSFISQLRESTLQGEIVQAVRDRVEAAQSDPELIEKAAEVRAQIEREAQARQAAIAGMFGSTATSGAGVAVESPLPRTRRRRDPQG